MSDINPIVIGMGRSEVVESYKSNPMVHRVKGTAMEQDFTKGLSVCIGNYGYYNEGELHDTWITLPKTEAEIRDFLHLNHLQDPLHEEIYISDYDGVPFGATQLFTEFCHLEDLNSGNCISSDHVSRFNVRYAS